MIDTITLILSIAIQLLAALLALRLIHITHHRTAWVLIASALILMIVRRIMALVVIDMYKDPILLDVYESIGMFISALMLMGLFYVRRYLYDTFSAERCIVESEHRYRTLAQNIPNGAVFLFDNNSHCTLADGPVLKLWGFSGERNEGKNIRQLSLPAPWIEKFLQMQESALNGVATSIEQFSRERSYSIQFAPIKNGGGAISNSMAIVLDITEQKNAEQERKNAYELLQRTIDGVAEPVMVIGMDYQVKLMNQVLCESYNNPLDATPKMCYSISHQRELPCNDPVHPCPFQQVRETLLPVTVIHEHQTSSGETRHVEIIASPLFDEKGDLQGLIEASRDITQRLKYETELLKLRKAVDASGEIILMTDREGTISFINPEFTRLYGYTWEEVVGKSTPRILKSGLLKENDYFGLWQTLLTNRVFKSEIINKTKDGRFLDIETTINPVLNEKGEIESFLAVQRDITQRKKAEKEKNGLLSAIECSVEGIAITDEHDQFMFINKAHADLYGYSKIELIGKSWRNLVPKESEEMIAKIVDQTLHNRDVGTFSMEESALTKDGSTRHVEVRAKSIWTEEGKYQGYIRSVVDITERKLAEEEKNRLTNAIEYSIGGIAIADQNDTLIYANDAYAGIYGYARAEIIGRSWRSLLSNRTEELFENNFYRPLHNKQIGFTILETKALRKDGSRIPIEVRAKALWDEYGRYGGHICNVIDLTDRLRADVALRRRAEELETLTHVSAAMRVAENQAELFLTILIQVISLFEGKGAALAIYDSETDLINIKLALGCWKNWMGQSCHSDNGISGSVLKTGHLYNTGDLPADTLFEWPNDNEVVTCAVCIPLMTSHRSIGVLWLGRHFGFTDKDLHLLNAIADMTASALHRQALQEDLQAKLAALQDAQAHIIQGEKLAAIGQLTSGIAHELNNPLTSVVLYAQMIQRRMNDDGAKRDLDKIISETLRASKIVRSLLDFARQRVPEKKITDVNDIVKSVLDFISYEFRAHDIHYELDLSPEIPTTLADAHQLQQVFINLLNNAWQAISETGHSGILRITTEYLQTTGTIRVTIEDNGLGIHQENLSKIFDPFFTTKPEGSGTGLGLSICHGIIANHGGRIWAESELGKGSKFFIELPVISADIEVIKDTDEQLSELQPDQNSHVLIIDDEQSVLEVLGRALRAKGFTVTATADPKIGLQKIADFDFSLILCDIRMPGMIGQEFYQEMCRIKPEFTNRFVFITGDTLNDKTRTFLKDKKISYLSKPFEIDELYKTIHLVGSKLSVEREFGSNITLITSGPSH